MAYGHAERNLALLRQLEAETGQLLESLDQPDPEQSAWLQEAASRGEVTGSLERAATDRSDKKNVILPNGQWLFLSLMDEHRGRRPDRATA